MSTTDTVIGTVYRNYHHSVLTVYLLYLSRSSPKVPQPSSLGARMSYMDLYVPSQV